MVATFLTKIDTGGTDDNPGASATVTNLRFNAEDTNDQDLLSPIVILASGTEFSFWKSIYLEATVAPDTQVDGVEIYSDGTLGWGTGITVFVGDGTQIHTSINTTGYDVADAQEVITNHSLVAAKTDLFTFTSGSARAVAINEAGGTIDAIGETADYIILSCEVADTAGSGTKATETITWSYDEI